MCVGGGVLKNKQNPVFCISTYYPDSVYFLSISEQYFFFTGGPEEAQGGQHGGGAVQPHEVPPLHRDVEEGGDRGLVLPRHLLLHEVLLGPSTAQSGH